MKIMIQLLAILSTVHLCIAFRGSHGGQLLGQRGVLAFSHHSAPKRGVAQYHSSNLQFPILDRQPVLVLKSTENSNDTEETTGQTETASGRLQNRRRRRKQQSSPLANVASQTEEDDDDWEEEEENSSLTPSFELKPRANAAVAMEVKDVRAVVGFVPQDFANTPQQREGQRPSSASKSPGRAISSPGSSSSLNTADSLERMLADARQMQLQEEENDDDQESDGVNLPKQIRGLLSNIVTIDFFIICGFLLWFLAGVFSSSVLKNDDIQIAFNNNFSAIVQPALGVLMVLSVASAVFKDPEEENEQ